MQESLLTISQACAFYHLSRPTLQDRIRQGLIRVKDLSPPGAKYRTLRVIPDLQADATEDQIKELDIRRRLGL
jgi:hypothetical protein